MGAEHLSVQTLRRLPRYLGFLRSLPAGVAHVSATQMAAALGLGEVAVRKDLAAVCNGGRPRTGYPVKRLTGDIHKLLVCREPACFAIVGMGRLGRALAGYPGFAEYGLHLAAVFDEDPALIGSAVGPRPILPSATVAAACRENGIGIGLITVPPEAAQDVCDALVAGGVRVIWNFAPAHLAAPPDVTVQHENMAASLGLLSRHLADEFTKETENGERGKQG